MENFFTRYRNPLVLMAVLFIQVIALATQVKRAEDPHAADSGGTRLIRVWTVTAITPFERGLVATGHFIRNTWHNYIDLRHVRRQNRDLQAEVDQLRMHELKLQQDADQARRLQVLLGFKQRYIGQTLAAQVIGSSGSEQSRVIYLDKGSRDGVKVDMPVITPDGIIGKIKEVFPLSSQVLLINDRESGAGVLFETSRLQGTIRGTSLGQLQVGYLMSDEPIQVGERVLTSGGDRVYPKGLPVGTVSAVGPDRDNEPFLAATIKPAADLDRLEEVLIITKVAEEKPSLAEGSQPVRAADILAERLPGLPKKPAAKELKPGEKPAGASTGTKPAGGAPAPVHATAGTAATPNHAQPAAGAAATTPGTAVTHPANTSGTPAGGAGTKTPAPHTGTTGTTAPQTTAPGTAVPRTTGSPAPPTTTPGGIPSTTAPGTATPHSGATQPGQASGPSGTQPPAHTRQGPGNGQPAAPQNHQAQPGNGQPPATHPAQPNHGKSGTAARPNTHKGVQPPPTSNPETKQPGTQQPAPSTEKPPR